MAKRHHASKHVKHNAIAGYHADSASEHFASGMKSGMDEMVSSSDGLFPEKVVMRDFPASGYASSHEPYDGMAGVDEQIDDDSRKLQKRSTRGAW